MDEIVDKIADWLGPRWCQLYLHLGLDYRGRFQIVASNQKADTVAARYRRCTRDTVKAWRDASQQGEEEEVVVSRLLDALRKIEGMKSRADELAKMSGLPLEDDSYTDFDKHVKLSKSIEGVPVTLLEDKEQEEISMLKKLVDVEKEFAPTCPGKQNANLQPLLYPRDNIAPLYPMPSRYDMKGSSRPYPPASIPHLHIIMEQKIDPKIREHKLALLDISQRLHAQNFLQICTMLELPEDDVQEIVSEEVLTEELYYRMLQLWLSREGEDHTFAKLVSILLTCDEQEALYRLKLRLVSGR